MAISLGVLVVIGILLVLVFVVLLCIGTGGVTAFETISNKFRKNNPGVNGAARTQDSTALQEVRADPPGNVSRAESPRETGKPCAGSGDEADEERLGEYDVPHPSIRVSHTKSLDGHVDEDERTSPREQVDEESRTDPGEEGDSDVIYQNTIVKPTPSPRPSARKIPAAEPDPKDGEDVGGDSDQLYQNVRVPKP